MMIVYFFKPTYSVSLNGEFIGYTQNKSELQAKINDAIQKGDGANLAFIQIDSMPEYKLCLLKKDVQTNDDEIYNKIVGQGTTYYRYMQYWKMAKKNIMYLNLKMQRTL